MLGFDAVYRNDLDDAEPADLSRRGRRILLTRDRGLLTRSAVAHGYLIRQAGPREQLAEVVRRFDIRDGLAELTRCMRRNGLLEPVDKAAILHRLLPKTRRYYDELAACRDCGRIYWKGSHYEDMRRRLEGLLERSAGRRLGGTA